MTKEEKLILVERLVNDKHITFTEGLALMESEKEYITYYPQPIIQPHHSPTFPLFTTTGALLHDN